MSKIVIPIYRNEDIDKLIALADEFILMTPHYAYVYDDSLDIDKAIELIKSHNKTPIIAINRIIMEDELNELSFFIDKYKGCDFTVSDLGLVELFIEKGLIQNVTYDPVTLVCNGEDLKIYNSFGFKNIALSNEIPLLDVKSSYDKSSAPIFYQIFGRKLMYYSKRKLVSAYEEYRNLDFKKEKLSLVEEKRNYHIPLFENENGTYCYRHYFISLLKELNNLKYLDSMYLESITLDIDTFVKVLNAYRDVLENKINIEEGLEIINSLSLDIEDGFIYSDTIHIKEKIIQ